MTLIGQLSGGRRSGRHGLDEDVYIQLHRPHPVLAARLQGAVEEVDRAGQDIDEIVEIEVDATAGCTIDVLSALDIGDDDELLESRQVHVDVRRGYGAHEAGAVNRGVGRADLPEFLGASAIVAAGRDVPAKGEILLDLSVQDIVARPQI